MQLICVKMCVTKCERFAFKSSSQEAICRFLEWVLGWIRFWLRAVGLMKRIRTVLVTGPLGSGKTVRVNQLLRECGSRKLTVLCVINDVGAENIDAKRVQSVGEILPLTTGCVCCESVGFLRATLKKAARSTVNLILIEPTGIADAGVIHKICAKELQLNWACLALVDVKHFALNRAIGIEQFQLPVATQIGLTWAEEARGMDDPLIESVLEYVGLYSRAPVTRLSKEVLPQRLVESLLSESKASFHHTCSAECTHEHHHEEAPVTTKTVWFHEGVTEEMLLPVLVKLFQNYNLVRGKGVVRVTNPDHGIGLHHWDFAQGDIILGEIALSGVPGGNFISNGTADVTEHVLPLVDQQKMCTNAKNTKIKWEHLPVTYRVFLLATPSPRSSTCSHSTQTPLRLRDEY